MSDVEFVVCQVQINDEAVRLQFEECCKVVCDARVWTMGVSGGAPVKKDGRTLQGAGGLVCKKCRVGMSKCAHASDVCVALHFEFRVEKNLRQVMPTERCGSGENWCFSGRGAVACLRGIVMDSLNDGRMSRSGRWIGMIVAGCGQSAGLIWAGGLSTKAGIGGTGGGGAAMVGLGGGER